MLLRDIRHPNIRDGRWEDRLQRVLEYIDEAYKEIDRALCSIDENNMTEDLRNTIKKLKER